MCTVYSAVANKFSDLKVKFQYLHKYICSFLHLKMVHEIDTTRNVRSYSPCVCIHIYTTFPLSSAGLQNKRRTSE